MTQDRYRVPTSSLSKLRLSSKSGELLYHDFYTLGSMLGAKAHYLHVVQKDWSDEGLIGILQKIESSILPDSGEILLKRDQQTRQRWEFAQHECRCIDHDGTGYAREEFTDSDWKNFGDRDGSQGTGSWWRIA